MSELPRDILKGDRQTQTVELLQKCLVDLIDFSLQGKQAHWNLVGSQFRSFHLQLDEIIDATRLASDEIAERIQTLSASADGRSNTVAEHSRLEQFPPGTITEPKAVTLIADRLMTVINGLRSAIEPLGELDPISEDLLISTSAGLEKHLWMVQAQEVN